MSYRDTQEDNYNQRLLANVVESDMQNDEEREYLRKYKKTLQHLKREKKELSKIKKQLNELYSEERTSTTSKIADLEETAQDIKTLILHYENYLLKLEITPPLSEVIERESVKAYLKQQEKEAEEIIKRYDEQRQEALKRLNEQEAKQNKEPIIEPPNRKPNRAETINKADTQNGLKSVLFTMVLMSISLTLPLIMLDAPFGIILVATTIIFLPCILMFVPPLEDLTSISYIIIWHLYNIVRPILYICGLVVTIQGTQDFFAIAFYILMGLQSMNIIKNFIGTIIIILLSLTQNKE